ncbi:DUF4166 domain-containing protein [Pseudoxanthomonas sp. UTMC 1351]|uniref:DUF4166 domain-containing protein n=1 Tax=Pseudoxanthomonas sp. UTMC 1351 TaxID=2695853 RepID=UPI0034CFCD5B
MDAAVNQPLFQRVLGDDFHTLPLVVQALHSRAGLHRYRGQVEVNRDRNPLAQLLAWATRLPPAGCGVIEVDIDANEHGESWVRKIGAAAMPSRLWMQDGLLCEQLGLARFGFRLTVEEGAIVWRVASVHTLGVPFPSRWFRSVQARESVDERGRYYFDVSASMPIAGLLVHYRGWLDAA